MLISEIIKQYIVVENDTAYIVAQKVYEEENNKEENRDIQLGDLGDIGDLWMSIAIHNKENITDVYFDEKDTQHDAKVSVGSELNIHNFRYAVAVMNAIKAKQDEIGPEALTDEFTNLFPSIYADKVILGDVDSSNSE